MAVNSKDEMTQRIRDERPVNWAGEGQRYRDLRRWGILQLTVKDATDIPGDLMYERALISITSRNLGRLLVEMQRNPKSDSKHGLHNYR